MEEQMRWKKEKKEKVIQKREGRKKDERVKEKK